MKLRDYQERAVDETRSALARNRAVCLVMQVGAGKTVVACEIIRRALERGRKCLFVVHRIELVEQAHDRLARFGIQAGIIKAGYQERRDRPVQVACVPTLIRREFPPADLTILDECHHAMSQSWLKVAKHYRECGWLVGITATATRLDGRGLGDIFDTLIEPVQTSELLASGHLLEPIVYAPPESCDRRGIRVRGGDFALPELAERMQRLTGSITKYWQRYGQGRRTLAFAVNVKHSQEIEAALQSVGARAMHVDGASSAGVRTEANQRLRAGTVDVVTQCALWTEGVDIPEIDCILVARPTASLALHRQMIGRGMRPAYGKTDCIVLDHAGNHHEHGLVTDPIAWSLDTPERKARAVGSVRTCAVCFAIIPPLAEVCPACGAAIEKRAESQPPGVDNPGELVAFTPKPVPRDEKRDTYRGLVLRASACGYRLGWARNQYRQQFGTWPKLGDMERELYVCAKHDWEERTFGYKRVERCTRCFETRALA